MTFFLVILKFENMGEKLQNHSKKKRKTLKKIFFVILELKFIRKGFRSTKNFFIIFKIFSNDSKA